MKESFSKRMKEAMELRNIKQVDLCERTGLGKSAISQYLSGTYEPKQKGVYKIAKALDVSEAWLMGYDVPIERIEHIKTDITKEEKKFLDLINRLDKEDKDNLQRYIEGVLLTNEKYDIKRGYKNA